MPAYTRTSAICLPQIQFEIFHVSDWSEQIANAMIYNMLIYFFLLYVFYFVYISILYVQG